MDITIHFDEPWNIGIEFADDLPAVFEIIADAGKLIKSMIELEEIVLRSVLRKLKMSCYLAIPDKNVEILLLNVSNYELLQGLSYLDDRD